MLDCGSLFGVWCWFRIDFAGWFVVECLVACLYSACGQVVCVGFCGSCAVIWCWGFGLWVCLVGDFCGWWLVSVVCGFKCLRIWWCGRVLELRCEIWWYGLLLFEL